MARTENLVVRAEIVETALGLFSQMGYQGVSMDAIARAHGLKKASLFHYFSTKELLGEAVLLRAREFIRGLLTADFPPDQPPYETFDAVFGRIELMISNRPAEAPNFYLLEKDMGRSNPRLAEAVAETHSMWVAFFADYLEGWKRQGYFRAEADVSTLAQAIHLIFVGTINLDTMPNATEMIRAAKFAILTLIAANRSK